MQTMELKENYAVISLPANAVEVEIKAKVYHDNGIVEVGRTLFLTDIRKAFQEAEDYIGEDTMFYLTDKGLDMAEQLGKEK